jgi:hypothetical protein
MTTLTAAPSARSQLATENTVLAVTTPLIHIEEFDLRRAKMTFCGLQFGLW